MIKCRKVYPQDEKKLMIRAFNVLVVLQTVFVITLCSISIYYLQSTNFTLFLPIDIITLMIAGIILSLIILMVGCASSSSNALFAWVWFHLFMLILFMVEILITVFTSKIGNVMDIAKKTWVDIYDDEKSEIQADLSCCGFANNTDNPALPCPSEIAELIGCKMKLIDFTTQIRDISAIALFIDLIFVVFLDFAGCGICLQPDVISYEQFDEDATTEEASATTLYSPTILVEPLFEVNIYT